MRLLFCNDFNSFGIVKMAVSHLTNQQQAIVAEKQRQFGEVLGVFVLRNPFDIIDESHS